MNQTPLSLLDGFHRLTTKTPETEGLPRLSERIELSFRESGHLQLREVRVVNFPGAIVLQGRVPSYYLKQIAQQLAMNLMDDRNLENQLEVRA